MTVAKRETDHEWKTRMAAEGRAIYVPGKTEEDINAERAQREKPRAITLHLSEDQLSELDTGLPDAMDLIRDAGAALCFMADHLSTGHVDREDHRAWAVMRLAARALRLAEDREIKTLDTLDTTLRLARARTGKGGAA